MATFYMTETLPTLIMAERAPGPEWLPVARKDAPQVSRKLSAAELGAALAIEVAKSRELRQQYAQQAPRTPTGGQSFGEMVASVMASENLSYGAAASKVSQERPDLYDEHRRAPNARYDYNDPEDGPYA